MFEFSVRSISVAMGFGGQFNATVANMVDRIVNNLMQPHPQTQANETFAISRDMKESFQCEKLYAEGLKTRIVCCVCGLIVGYKDGSGETHTYCGEHYSVAMNELKELVTIKQYLESCGG